MTICCSFVYALAYLLPRLSPSKKEDAFHAIRLKMNSAFLLQQKAAHHIVSGLKQIVMPDTVRVFGARPKEPCYVPAVLSANQYQYR